MLTEEEVADLRLALIKGEWCSEDLADLLRALYPSLDLDDQAQVEDTFHKHELDL